MTKAQERKIEWLKEEMERAFVKDERYEFKELVVTEHDYGTVELVMTTGMKDDEGTLAEVFCRQSVQLFIGERGGVRYYKAKRGTRTSFHGIWSAYIEQKV